MVSDCLGQLAFLDPPTFVPALRAKLADPSPAVRCGVVAAARHVLHEGEHPVDALLATCVSWGGWTWWAVQDFALAR